MFLAIILFLAALFVGYIFLRICMHSDEGLVGIPLFVIALFFCVYLAVSNGVGQQLAVVLALVGALFGAIASFAQDARKALS